MIWPLEDHGGVWRTLSQRIQSTAETVVQKNQHPPPACGVRALFLVTSLHHAANILPLLAVLLGWVDKFGN